MRKVIYIALLVVLGLLVYQFVLKPPSFENGEKAPNIKSTLVNGEEFQLTDLKGKYVLLDFWGSWCAPCRKEMPALKAFYNDYHDKQYAHAAGFEIVSVALEKSDEYTKRIIAQENLRWPYHIIEVTPVVLMSSIAQKYSVKQLPTKFLINPEGDIMGNDLSFEEMRRLLDARLK